MEPLKSLPPIDITTPIPIPIPVPLTTSLPFSIYIDNSLPTCTSTLSSSLNVPLQSFVREFKGSILLFTEINGITYTCHMSCYDMLCAFAYDEISCHVVWCHRQLHSIMSCHVTSYHIGYWLHDEWRNMCSIWKQWRCNDVEWKLNSPTA